MNPLKALRTVVTLVRDRRYRRLFLRTLSFKAIQQAGFIAEPIFIDGRPSVGSSMVERFFLKTKQGVILVSTGCYAPVHDGHVTALIKAREHIEHTGGKVIAGFMSPCHIDYVNTKTDRYSWYDNRFTELQLKLIKTAPWIKPFMTEADDKAPLNFTTVISRLERVYPNCQIVYVYGSDNIDFGAVLDGELNICVKRNGHQGNISFFGQIIIDGDPAYQELSSSKIRGLS